MKRKTIIFIAVACVLVMSLASVRVFHTEGDTVRVIMLDGIISSSVSSYASGITPKIVEECLGDAEDDGVGAVVLRVNSPGGSVVASQDILAVIRQFKGNTGVPVVVSMGEVAASGGYYISLGADSIVASPGTLTGSIGVIAEFTYLGGLYEKLGIETEIVKSGEHKDIGSKPMSDEERGIMQGVCDNLYDQFVFEVSESRNIPVERVYALATGQIFTGEQALELGLVDKVGSLDDAVDLIASLAGIEEPNVQKEYPSSGGLFGMVSSLFQRHTIISAEYRAE